MKKISLTQGQFALVDDEDFERINKNRWYARYCDFTKSFYALRNGKKADGAMNCKSIVMAREIMNTGPDETCDHIDHDTLNNQKYNLRNCTKKNNCRNKRIIEKSSKYKGVHLSKDKYTLSDGTKKIHIRWKAQFSDDNGRITLGSFISEIEAALRYDEEAFKVYGEFALLNFPNNLDIYKFVNRNKFEFVSIHDRLTVDQNRLRKQFKKICLSE